MTLRIEELNATNCKTYLLTVGSEAAHYEMLARYVLTFGLADDLRRLSTNPVDCEGFAAGYNGPGYRRFSYHTKLAAAMR